MILYVYLQGGLGNQMFQYAAGLSALKEYPQFTDLRLDGSFYANQERKVIVNGMTGRGFDLDLFNIKYNTCLLYTSPSPRDVEESRMPSSA